MNRVAIVTGGSRGIGFEVAKGLIEEGYATVICSRNLKELNSAVKKLIPIGNVFGVRADVSNFRDCQRLVNSVKKKFGRLDALINNAGVVDPLSPLENVDIKEWEQNIMINLMGVVNCTKLAILLMKKSGHGKIINFAGAGVGGPQVLPNFSAYYTAKTAVVAFTEVIASELKGYNIQVNCISPGGVNTNITLKTLRYGKRIIGEDVYKNTLRQLKDGGTPASLAVNLIIFLCSDKANQISGKMLSAKWDRISDLQKIPNQHNLFKLRRVDNSLFYEKKSN